ncbi:MAG: hypothetical protein ABI134_15070 [Byssovorax sp.]
MDATRNRKRSPLVALGRATATIAILLPGSAGAATYAVGPRRELRDLQAVAARLQPGDVVLVDGDATYPGDLLLRNDGAAGKKITIRGRRVAGKRPVLAGGRTTIEIRGSHYQIEGFELTGGAVRCVFHHANDVTLADSVIHDCPRHGLLGADDDTGSLTLQYVEVYHAGAGDSAHPIYMATDERAYPGSVFRMEHCYLHDQNGGNNVKSRAERNELHYNWIEGARYHEIELIGPDSAEHHNREDSDVVANVIKKLHPGYVVRVGGDGSGESNGRYRFANNTIVLGPETRAVFRLFNGLESIEMHNNAFFREGGGGVRVLYEDDVRWARGRPLCAGTHNWLPRGSTSIPREWDSTLFGVDPGFVSPQDLRPAAGSPLIDAGSDVLPSPPRSEFPSPLREAQSSPPIGQLQAQLSSTPRGRVGAIDIGAFEYIASGPAVASGDGPARPAEPEPPKPGHPPRPSPPFFPRIVRGACGCDCGGGAGNLHALALGGLIVLVCLARRRWRRTRR